MGRSREDFLNKARYLGYMVYKILLVHLHITDLDNRDHCAHRRYGF